MHLHVIIYICHHSPCFQIYLAKINKRVRDYKINVLNEPRVGKKLLVLDIDYTLFDHRSVAETGMFLKNYCKHLLVS